MLQPYKSAGLVVRPRKPAFLNFTAGNSVLCYQERPFPFFWPFALLFLRVLIYIFPLTLHSYKYINISVINLYRGRYALAWAIQREYQFNQHKPWPRHFQVHCVQSCHSPQGPWPILAIVCISPSSILIIFPSAVPVNSTSAKTTGVISLITKL